MKILFVDTVHPFLKEELEKQKHICNTAYDKSKDEVLQILQNYDGLIIRSRFSIDRTFIDQSNDLKFIARAGSGLENIDVDYAKTKGIKCLNAAEGNRQAVSEHTLAMLLTLFNNLNAADKEVRAGIWKREANRGEELAGKTVGIIGYGNNGSAFAQLLKGFDVQILAYDKYLEDYPFKSDMSTIFQSADILSLHIPLTEETTYLVDENYINQFQKPIYFINTARGKCIKISDLVVAMQKGKVLGACLDVLEQEKTSFEALRKEKLLTELNYLFASEKTIFSPHIAGWTKQSNQKIAAVLLQKITALA